MKNLLLEVLETFYINKTAIVYYIVTILIMIVSKISVNGNELNVLHKFILGSIFYNIIVVSLVITALIAGKFFK